MGKPSTAGTYSGIFKLSKSEENEEEKIDLYWSQESSKEEKMKQIKGIYLITLLAGVLCLGLMPGSDGFAADRNACSEDIAKFCPDVKLSDRGAVIDCLEAHENELSDACKALEERMGGGRTESREITRQQKAVLQACKDDAVKFCKDVNPAGGGILGCLNAHENELSAACSESIKTAKGEKRKTQ